MINYLASIKSKKPVIHCIQNHVSAADCANALLGIGASPIMAEAPEEVCRITSASDGLVLNLGILTADKAEAMRISAQSANNSNLPLVLDPVGVGASAFRLNTARLLLEGFKCDLIRGNFAEISALSGNLNSTHGVGIKESENSEIAKAYASRLSEKYRSVVAVTGKTDVVALGRRTAFIQNGSPMLSRITGTGCILSAICAAFLSVSPDPFDAAVKAISFLGICGEHAELSSQGLGSMKVKLMDILGNSTDKMLNENARIAYE